MESKTGIRKVKAQQDKRAHLISAFVENKDPCSVPDKVNMELCKDCTICCEHVALEIDEPEDEEDFQNIMWYVMHHNVIVFVDEDDDWFIEFKAKCKALDKGGLCSIHTKRPLICKEYSQDTCERHGEDSPYKVLFKTREDVVDWVRNNTKLTNFGE